MDDDRRMVEQSGRDEDRIKQIEIEKSTNAQRIRDEDRIRQIEREKEEQRKEEERRQQEQNRDKGSPLSSV